MDLDEILNLPNKQVEDSAKDLNHHLINLFSPPNN